MPEFTPITFQGKIKTHTCFFMNYTNNMVKCRGFALDLRTVSSCMTRNWSARSWRMKELTQNVIRFHWWKLTQNARRELCSISSIHSIIICDLLWRPMFEFLKNKQNLCTCTSLQFLSCLFIQERSRLAKHTKPSTAEHQTKRNQAVYTRAESVRRRISHVAFKLWQQ